MTETFSLSTERLVLRPHGIEDVPFFIKLNGDPEVIRYTGDKAFKNTEDAVKKKMGRFAVLEKSTTKKAGKKIGWCGLKWLAEANAVELGYRFLQSEWGKGYATEASMASLRVVEKLGMTLAKKVQCHGMEALEFEIFKGPFLRNSKNL
jgi:RimJ/RimL family protein N-acetyltransferase